jgi:ethanolaminephosphotransferase
MLAAHIKSQEAGHKNLGLKAAALHLIAIICPLAISTIWLWAPTTQPFLCRATNINVGLVYALMASRLIMAHMCKEPFSPPLLLIAGLAVGAANSRLRLASPLAVTVTLGVVALLAYLHYVLSVINEICSFLGIRCLSLQRPAAAAGAAASAAAPEKVD